MIKKLQNPLSEQQANDIEQAVSDKFFPWYYFQNVHGVENDSEVTYGFQHTVMDYGTENSTMCDLAKLITHSVANSAGLTINSIYHLRLNLLTKQFVYIKPHFHVDFPANFSEENSHFGKHYSGVYYINNSDGCTVFEESKQEIEPIKNTAVVFDCKLRHSASYPKINQIRFVLNMNFFANE
jgi:hypothetical protein